VGRTLHAAPSAFRVVWPWVVLPDFPVNL